ncbi:MAG: GIY-YIG nuclease family protein [Chloroflexi bacterium]|nr:GIY-YIG nuclease family protein [Chloroflexota bacterium]
MFYVYNLKSGKNGAYYVGSTVDLKQRLERHNRGMVQATKYILPLTVVYSESCGTLQQARQREAFIKRQKSRRYIQDLISDDAQSGKAPGNAESPRHSQIGGHKYDYRDRASRYRPGGPGCKAGHNTG